MSVAGTILRVNSTHTLGIDFDIVPGRVTITDCTPEPLVLHNIAPTPIQPVTDPLEVELLPPSPGQPADAAVLRIKVGSPRWPGTQRWTSLVVWRAEERMGEGWDYEAFVRGNLRLVEASLVMSYDEMVPEIEAAVRSWIVAHNIAPTPIQAGTAADAAKPKAWEPRTAAANHSISEGQRVRYVQGMWGKPGLSKAHEGDRDDGKAAETLLPGWAVKERAEGEWVAVPPEDGKDA